jgi:hypothetical protein
VTRPDASGCGPVTIRRANGSTETREPYTPAEVGAIVKPSRRGPGRLSHPDPADRDEDATT